jgi:subtilisin-like proprotein convertase family protein
MKYLISLILITIVLTVAACTEKSRQTIDNLHLSTSRSPVIYGDDTRVDLYEINRKEVLEMARSTVSVLQYNQLTKLNDSQMKLPAEIYGEDRDLNLCENVRFYNQPKASPCSGFLISENIVITAGHCALKLDFCEKAAFVFDYSIDTPDRDPTIVPTSSVYRCKRIHRLDHPSINRRKFLSLGESFKRKKLDYAIIELDRPVNDRSPLDYRKSGHIWQKALLTIIGTPAGLPLKVSEGIDSQVRVSNNNLDIFIAEVDSFHGNSGGPVINSETGKVEGILIRGEDDYVKDEARGCYIPKVCKSGDCRGEDVLRITSFSKFLPENLPANVYENVVETFEADLSNQEIPDKSEDPKGVTFNFEVDSNRQVLGLTLELELAHPYPGDFAIHLAPPYSGEILITKRIPDPANRERFTVRYGYNGLTALDFHKFWHKNAKGTWKLRVSDHGDLEVGTVFKAKLIFNLGELIETGPAPIPTPTPVLTPEPIVDAPDVPISTNIPVTSEAPIISRTPQDEKPLSCNGFMLNICKVFASEDSCITRWCK